MDERQRDFLDNIEADLATPEPRSKTGSKRLGAIGAVVAAGTAFLTLSPAPAQAAPASPARTNAGPAGVHPLVDCYAPDRLAQDYTKGCGDGSYVNFHYLGQTPCGPGGINSILNFDRTFFSACTGEVDIGGASTSCG